MKSKSGFESLNRILSNDKNSNITNTGFKPVIGRVIDVIQDETHPDFDKYGGYDGIGTIKFSLYNQRTSNENLQVLTAKRFSSNIKKFPLKEELVYILPLNVNPSGKKYLTDYYYLDTINIWNTNHINLLPSFNSVNSNSSITNIQEDENIGNVITGYGEIAYEGRWKNSLLFGNGLYNKTNFLLEGKNPFILLLNNNSNIEDIYKGYLTSFDNSQDSFISIIKDRVNSKLVIPFHLSNYKIKQLNEYDDEQIIIKSKRIFLFSNSDEIIQYSRKNFFIGTDKSVNIQATDNIILQSKKTQLNGKESDQSVLYGNKTNEVLIKLTDTLIKLTDSLSKIVSTPEGTPLGEINIISQDLSLILNELKITLEKKTLLSENVFL